MNGMGRDGGPEVGRANAGSVTGRMAGGARVPAELGGEAPPADGRGGRRPCGRTGGRSPREPPGASGRIQGRRRLRAAGQRRRKGLDPADPPVTAHGAALDVQTGEAQYQGGDGLRRRGCGHGGAGEQLPEPAVVGAHDPGHADRARARLDLPVASSDETMLS